MARSPALIWPRIDQPRRLVLNGDLLRMDNHEPPHVMDDDSRPLIRLWEAVGLGVILVYPSGIRYGNQAGGPNCLHPAQEGIYLSLRNDVLENGMVCGPAVDLWAYFTGPKHKSMGALGGLDEADAAALDGILARYNLDTMLRVDRTRLHESYEAWVWVEVFALDRGLIYLPPSSPPVQRGILTWENSD